MHKLNVSLGKNSYPVFIGKNIFKKVQEIIDELNLNKNISVITDGNVEKYFGKEIRKTLSVNKGKTAYYKLTPGEKSKSYTELNKIYSHLIENKFSRNSLIVAIGGGVTGDLAGYAASTFMRGIQLMHIPTTLLAAVDSSIGGKTGINFLKTKNIIGSFYQPKSVLIDIDFLRTLDQREFFSGVGEVVKYAFISDKEFYKYFLQNFEKLYSFDEEFIVNIIKKSAAVKADVVSKDEKESGLRKILNFGHTFAHAFESDLNFKIKHGEAVTAGIIAAIFLSNKTGLLSDNKLQEIIQLPLKIKLPENLLKINDKNILNLMLLDKKSRSGKIKFVLLSDVGKILLDKEAEKKDIIFSLKKLREVLV